MEYGKCARKAGNTILAALAVVVISVGPVAAQEGTFHALFSEGYGFLQKKVEGLKQNLPRQQIKKKRNEKIKLRRNRLNQTIKGTV